MIIKVRATKTIADVPIGQPFRLLSDSKRVYVLVHGAKGIIYPTEKSVPIVLLIDSDQHETQDTYRSPGDIVLCDSACQVEFLDLVKPPTYVVA